MEKRDRLSHDERRRIQLAYLQGPESQKQMIQALFSDQVTFESCVAMLQGYVREAALEGRVKQVAIPSEADFWDRMCRAAWHGNIWEGRYKNECGGKIDEWMEIHCQITGNIPFFGKTGLDFENYMVPPPVPSMDDEHNKRLSKYAFHTG